MTDKPKQKQPPKKPDTEHCARLSQALKANLHRRKEQTKPTLLH